MGDRPIDEVGNETIVVFGQLEMEHQAAPHERDGKDPLFVGRDHDKRRLALNLDRVGLAERGKAPGPERLEEAVGDVRVGLVDLIQKDDAAPCRGRH